MKRILIIGASGTIGSALVEHLSGPNELFTVSRQDLDYTDAQLSSLANQIKSSGKLQQVYCCIGALHNEVLSPEKRLSQLDGTVLAEYFRINSILPALCLKHFAPLLDNVSSSQFLVLSAMVGSIADNALGGWYGYRASKAALNMLVKTASIEIGRLNKTACLATIHPGTTQGELSRPFSSAVSKDRYYTPSQSAERIVRVADALSAGDSGQFFNWDGSKLDW